MSHMTKSPERITVGYMDTSFIVSQNLWLQPWNVVSENRSDIMGPAFLSHHVLLLTRVILLKLAISLAQNYNL